MGAGYGEPLPHSCRVRYNRRGGTAGRRRCLESGAVASHAQGNCAQRSGTDADGQRQWAAHTVARPYIRQPPEKEIRRQRRIILTGAGQRHHCSVMLPIRREKGTPAGTQGRKTTGPTVQNTGVAGLPDGTLIVPRQVRVPSVERGLCRLMTKPGGWRWRMEGATWLGTGLARDLALLRSSEIAPDPVLAVAWGEVPTKARERASRFATATVKRCWSEDDRLRWFGPITLPTDLPWDALFLAYTNGLALDGVLQPGGGHRAERLERRLSRFVDAHGIMPIVRVFCTYRAYEHGLALTTYGDTMTEAEFLTGRLHLPGFSHYCRGDLVYGIAHSAPAHA